MRHKIGRKNFNIYAMDFETHADNDLVNRYLADPNSVETGVWLWYLIDEESEYDDKKVYGFNLDTLFKRFRELSAPNKKEHKGGHVMIYDYNLAFEWSFMLPYMKKNKFEYKDNFEDDDENVYRIITNSSMSSVWEIRLKLHKGDSLIIIRDLCKILGGGTLRKLAKSYGLETQKGDIDYRFNRRVYNDENDFPHYYGEVGELPEYIPTKEELIYCFKDVKIIMEILTNDVLIDDNAFWKSLSSSSYSMLKAINYGFKDSYKPKVAYRKLYPELEQKESDFLRNGVGGGITYVTPKYQYKEVKKGQIIGNFRCYGISHIDLHQAHPSNMWSRDLPYGKGNYYQFKASAKLNTQAFIENEGALFPGRITCVRILVSYTGAYLHCCIPLIGIDQANNIELTVWDFEILTMLKCYKNLKIVLLDCYIYRKRKLPFNEYYNENYQLRKQAKAIKDDYHIAYYKLLNNGTFGKFLEHGHNVTYIPTLSDDGYNITSQEITPEDDDEYTINGCYTYLPVGSCIPAYTRCVLINQALEIGWQWICYFDTDSIFFIDNAITRDVIPNIPMEDALCNWGEEPHIDRAQFACPKRYKLELTEGKTEAHVAGFNIDKKEKYDDINIVEDERRIQRAYRIKGGTIIAPQLKQISIDDKYRLIYDTNTGNIDFTYRN